MRLFLLAWYQIAIFSCLFGASKANLEKRDPSNQTCVTTLISTSTLKGALCFVMAMRSSAPLNQLVKVERTEGGHCRYLGRLSVYDLPLRRPADWTALMILRSASPESEAHHTMMRHVRWRKKGQIPRALLSV